MPAKYCLARSSAEDDDSACPAASTIGWYDGHQPRNRSLVQMSMEEGRELQRIARRPRRAAGL
jgi:hypothetical protein